MKKVIIVHCWAGNPDYCWYPSAKAELEKAGFEVIVPEMPDTDNPNMSTWVPKLAGAVGTPSPDVFLVGHSIGGVAIMRYLESLPAGTKVGGVVFVASFTHDLGFEEIKNFFISPLDFKKIKSTTKNFADIASDNDPFVPLDQAEVLRENLGADVLTLKKMGHFSGAADGEAACTELPEVAKFVKKFAHR